MPLTKKHFWSWNAFGPLPHSNNVLLDGEVARLTDPRNVVQEVFGGDVERVEGRELAPPGVTFLYPGLCPQLPDSLQPHCVCVLCVSQGPDVLPAGGG